mgnify:CR=1 FL=1
MIIPVEVPETVLSVTREPDSEIVDAEEVPTVAEVRFGASEVTVLTVQPFSSQCVTVTVVYDAEETVTVLGEAVLDGL